MEKHVIIEQTASGSALVLGGGGAKGLSHIGVLKCLKENDIKISSITGTSIGALLGGLYAIGKTPREIEDIALAIDLKQVINLFSPTMSKSGITSGKKVEEYLVSLFGETRIEDLNIPYKAVSTDIKSGNEVVFQEGKIVDAIRASISIPLVFEPVIMGGAILVDGGLVNPVPVNIANESYDTPIIAVNVINKPDNDRTPAKSEKNSTLLTLFDKLDDLGINSKKLKDMMMKNHDIPGVKKIMMLSTEITQSRIIELTMRLHKPDIYIEPEVAEYSLFDFHKSKEIIERGYTAAVSAIENFRNNNTLT